MDEQDKWAEENYRKSLEQTALENQQWEQAMENEQAALAAREQRILIALCSDDGWWLPASEIGSRCPSDTCDRKLLKRRAYRCGDRCEDNIVCFSVADLRAHRMEYHGVFVWPVTP